MSRKRDAWEKIRRQEKTRRQRGIASGPAPLGKVVRYLLARRADREYGAIDVAAKAARRRFMVCPLVKPLLEAKDIEIERVINAVKSALASPRFALPSVPVRFWLYNREVEEISQQAIRLGGCIAVRDIPKEFHAWLLKFTRKESAKCPR
jgi:hypothetical protein